MTDYDRLYRQLHPKAMPYSPWERQRELQDLWPVDQQRFRDHIATAIRNLKSETIS